MVASDSPLLYVRPADRPSKKILNNVFAINRKARRPLFSEAVMDG